MLIVKKIPGSVMDIMTFNSWHICIFFPRRSMCPLFHLFSYQFGAWFSYEGIECVMKS